MTFPSVAAGRRIAGSLARMGRLFTGSAALGLLALLLVGGCRMDPEHFPQTALFPISDFAKIGDAVQTTTFYWAVGVFILVEGALLYVMFRYRGKPNDPEPAQIHGNTAIEIIWTLIPALILAAIAVPTVRGIFDTNATPKGDALKIEVIAHQWWWEFRYPEYNITTANQLYIPVGRKVALKELSADVIHSFWAPRFAGKRDVFPNRETRLWFTAEKAGEYPGQCTEFCGIQHARMSFRVMAQEPADFEAWVKHMQSLGPKSVAVAPTPAPAESLQTRTASAGGTVQEQGKAPQVQAPAVPAPSSPADSLYAAGEKLFTLKGCVGCHSLQAYQAPNGMIGPNLANVGSRTWIAAGTLKNTPENLVHWIRFPQTVKEGVKMPNLGVTEAEATALAAFLRAHH